MTSSKVPAVKPIERKGRAPRRKLYHPLTLAERAELQALAERILKQ